MTKTKRALGPRGSHFALTLGAAILLASTGLFCDDRAPMKEAARSPGLAESAGSQTMRSASRRLPDAEITAAIERSMFLDDAVNSQDVHVVTIRGVVELTGTVDNLLAKQRAERLASVIKGVRSVSNRLGVAPIERSDGEIAEDVKAALRWDPVTERTEVTVTVHDQRVRLEGAVDSWAERDLVERRAMGVRGVRDVTNRVRVDYGAKRAAEEISDDVESRLRWDALVDERRIDVDVAEGRVKLTGVVGSLAEKWRAQESVLSVSGVTSVNTDELVVEPRANGPYPKERKYGVVSDAEIAKALRDAFLLDPRFTAGAITADVRSGKVTLHGEVETLRARSVAEELARNTAGVILVDNEIALHSDETIGDQRLKTTLEQAFERSPIVHKYNVSLSVADGRVTLDGTVDSLLEKAEAIDIANSTPGVQSVDESLRVRIPKPFARAPYLHPYYPYAADSDYVSKAPLKSDSEIREDIQHELYWSPFVNSKTVRVSVQRGVATLTGRVDSPREATAATENALQGGAIQVQNKLVW